MRGLDYYTRTVFEVWASSLGNQIAVCGGGRYDDLAEMLGGRVTPAVGFAAGMDRIVLALREEEIEPPALPNPQVLVAYQGDSAKREAVKLATQLRQAEVRAVITFDNRSLKAQLKQADREGVQYALIIGEQEMAEGKVTIRKMGEPIGKVIHTVANIAGLSEANMPNTSSKQTSVEMREIIVWAKQSVRDR